ncbi:class I adenylate-forming enzyme family protein [soil metagenome]
MSEPLQTAQPPSASTSGMALTLDDLFRRTVSRQPDAVALIDPPNKLRITGEAPLQLTFAQADQAVSAIAARFVESGLPPGSIVAMQLPNTVEFVVTALAAIRAGLVVALLPQLWRQSELTTALNRIGARAIVGISRIEIVDHADLALNAAAEAFSIRHVFGFGNDLPEGMAPLSIATSGMNGWLPPAPPDARRPAIISFDVTPDGFRAIPRNHLQLISGGLAIFLESGFPQGAKLLSAMMPASFAGFAANVMTWLLSGGSLALHHAADLQVLEKQIVDDHCDALIAPALLALRLADSGVFARPQSAVKAVIGLWRAPDRVASSENWQEASATFTDVYLFGEMGLFAARRLADGSPAPVTPGPFGAPRSAASSKSIGEIIVTPKATLALRGAMVPVTAYRTPSGDSLMETAPHDYADTGYAVHLDRAKGTLAITAPPVGIVGVGGYRFVAQELDEWARRLAAGAMLTVLPDQLTGFRLAGHASDNRRAREALGELGLNPLMVEAFRDRSNST